MVPLQSNKEVKCVNVYHDRKMHLSWRRNVPVFLKIVPIIFWILLDAWDTLVVINECNCLKKWTKMGPNILSTDLCPCFLPIAAHDLF